MFDRNKVRESLGAPANPDCSGLLRRSLDIMALVDRDGVIRCVSPAVTRILGFSPAELTGRSLFDLLNPEDSGKVKAGLDRIIQGAAIGRTALFRVRRKDGSWRVLEAIGRKLTDDQDSPAVAIETRDITRRKLALKALRQSRRFVRHIAASVPDPLVIYDLVQGRFVYANRDVLGYPPEQIQAMSGDQFAELVHPDDKPMLAERLAKLRRGRSGEVFEVEFRLKDIQGRWHWISSRDTILKRTREGLAQQTISVLRDITARKQAESDLEAHEAELRRSREELRALAARLLTVAEDERKALSRELHDDLNQRLAIFAIDLETLASGLPPEQPLRREMESLTARIVELTEDVRRIAYRLRPSLLDDLGLVPALRSYCEQLKGREGMAVAFTYSELPPTLKPEQALCLYRVAQEALRNVAKHARTRRAAVTLSVDGADVVLNVRDWGAGFDPAAAQSRGLGMIGMVERVRLVGGAFEVRSHPGQGADIEVRIPCVLEEA
ncbi:MAG: PAS domain S-box protein [Rhodospirillales bacterium]